MASSLATTPSVSAKNKLHSSCYSPICHPHYSLTHSHLSFRLSSPISITRLSAKGVQSSWNRPTLIKAQLNEVADGSTNAAATSLEAESRETEAKDAKPSSEPTSASEESVSDFIAQVANLVKLVDSRDIVELQLKQLDCELLIRKNEALPRPPAPAPVMMHAPVQQPTSHALSLAPLSTPSAPTPAAAPPAAAPPAPVSAKSSHPPLKCPMAGTFYRRPAPGEPKFVKIGDKVQKGQVLCIIEAMKLMNEIEADHSGTVTEILVDEGKPVSVDMPLFVIVP